MESSQPTENEFSRLSIPDLISKGIESVLAIRESEHLLQELEEEYGPNPHHLELICQREEVEKRKAVLQRVTTLLGALPHTPVDATVDISPLKAWVEEHREEFAAFSAYCDNYRPPSPLEEGEVTPHVDMLWSAVKRIELQIEELSQIANPTAYDMKRRVKKLHDAHRRTQELFSTSMSKFSFVELGAEVQRVAVEQHILRIARDEFDKIVQGSGSCDPCFWVHPLRGGSEISGIDGAERG